MKGWREVEDVLLGGDRQFFAESRIDQKIVDMCWAMTATPTGVLRRLKRGSPWKTFYHCQFCGNLRIPIYGKQSAEHVRRHLCDLGAERLAAFISLVSIVGSKEARKQFGICQSFWKKLRSESHG